MWVHQKQLYGQQPLPSYPSSSDASWSSLGASLPRYLMNNLERPLQEGLDQGVPLPLIEFPPSSPVLKEIVLHPQSPLSPPHLANQSSSPVEDRSGRTLLVGGSEEERAEVSSVEVEHSAEVEGSGEGSSGPSPDISESSSGWWFSLERRVLLEL